MNKPNWIEEHIDKILVNVNVASYRERIKSELMEHITESYQELIGRGYSIELAKSEAIDLLGDTEKLQNEYKVSCCHVKCANLGYFWRVVITGSFLIGISYILSFVVLGLLGFTYDAQLEQRSIPIIGNTAALIVFGLILFIVPFSIGAIYFSKAFKYRANQLSDIMLGLSFAWVGEKLAVLSISAFIYDMKIWQFQELLYRISGGGDNTAPYFTMEYILLTLLGCIILSFVSSRLTKNDQSKPSLKQTT